MEILAVGQLLTVTSSVTKQTNVLTRFIQNIQWENILGKIVAVTIELLLLSILFWIINRVTHLVLERSFTNYRAKRNLSEGRSQTIYTLILNIVKYLILFFYLYAILSILGVPVGTLIASAGILSVAIGLGAQSLVKDFLSGIFILLEQQLDVGDHIKVGTIEGTVMAVGLRTTQVKSFDGTLNFIPNSNINIVSNLSRSNMRVQIDVRLFPETDSEHVQQVLADVNQELTPKYPEIQSGPDVFGLVDLGNGNFAVRVILYTKNGAQGRIQSDFLAAYISALSDAGIKLPSTPLSTTN